MGVAGTVARPLPFPLCHLTMATSNTLAGLRKDPACTKSKLQSGLIWEMIFLQAHM